MQSAPRPLKEVLPASDYTDWGHIACLATRELLAKNRYFANYWGLGRFPIRPREVVGEIAC